MEMHRITGVVRCGSCSSLCAPDSFWSWHGPRVKLKVWKERRVIDRRARPLLKPLQRLVGNTFWSCVSSIHCSFSPATFIKLSRDTVHSSLELLRKTIHGALTQAKQPL